MSKQEVPTIREIPITTGTLLPVEQDIPPLILKHTDMQATIIGPLAHVQVTQQFHNTHTKPVEAIYVFPLPEDAAVTDLTMTIGERKITGDIREREQARHEYEEARESGSGAALLEQERPNIFTVSVANIQPDEAVQVAFTFHDRVPYDDNVFAFTLPTVVLPRYTPQDPEAQADAERLQSPLIPAEVRDGHTLSIRVELDAGKVTSITSPSHQIDIENQQSKALITLPVADEIPNKDFVLRYGVAGKQFEATPFTYRAAGEAGTVLFMLTPQVEPAAEEIFPREVLFVLDRSGSMGGDSIVQARNALRSCLRALNPGDTFNIIPFDNHVEHFSPHPLPFTQEHIDRADSYIEQIQARGGTEILGALTHAFNQPRSAEHLRIIVFLTDGAVGNEDQVLRELRGGLNEARVYAFGIGTAVNRFLLDKLAEVGRGSVEYIFPGQDIEDAVQHFQNRAAFPVLTDVQLDWGKKAHVRDIYPTPLPDLYAGQPLVVLARFHGTGQDTITLTGKTRQGNYKRTLQVEWPQATPDRSEHWQALQRVWARARIDALMSQERDAPESRSKVRDEILGLALEHRLLSPYTSFVAREEHRSEHDGREQAEQVMVPIHLPQGTVREAFEHPQFRGGRSTGGVFLRRANTTATPAAMPALADAAAASAPRAKKTDGISGLFFRSTPEPAMDMGIVAQEAEAEDAYAAPPPPVADDDECQEPALRYLARCQRVSGAWGNESPIATVLAVQAFLHAGHTEHSGDFRPQLRRAIAWLKASASQDAVPPVIAWGLATLASTTGDATYSTERDKAIASTTTALDELDLLCLTLARDSASSAAVSAPALPAQQDERWALAVALLHQISGQVPDETRSLLVQSQMPGGSVEGGVALPGHSVEQPDDTTIAATAVLALVC